MSSDDALKPLWSKDGEPIFDESWQAEALAIADNLVRQNMFSAAQWSAALGKFLKKAESESQPDNSLTYYNAVLAALEELVSNHSQVQVFDLINKRKDWEDAYLSTPHGKPVVLKTI